MSRRGFDRFMIDLDISSNAKIGRFTDAEFRCLISGVWPLAAKADPRGSLRVGALPAEPQDIARQAHMPVGVARRTLEKMRSLGMLESHPDFDCETIHDWHLHQVEPSVDLNAGRRYQLRRDPELRAAIRARDGDICRYCGITVAWTDRRSPAGGTYDHLDPRGDNTLENLVVACRGCNSRKHCRTPEEAGMELLVPKSRSKSGPKSDLGPTKTRREVEEEVSTDVDTSSVVTELCSLLADRVEANGSKRPVVTKGWQDAARLMLDRDGRDPAEARRLIDWCQASEFWRSNVLSMPKFRDKYDTLRLQAEREGPGKVAHLPQRTPAPYERPLDAEQIARYSNLEQRR